MGLPAGFMRLKMYVTFDVIKHAFTVRYDILDYQDQELARFRAHSSLLYTITGITLLGYIWCWDA